MFSSNLMSPNISLHKKLYINVEGVSITILTFLITRLSYLIRGPYQEKRARIYIRGTLKGQPPLYIEQSACTVSAYGVRTPILRLGARGTISGALIQINKKRT
jgi:hypothetical protein